MELRSAQAMQMPYPLHYLSSEPNPIFVCCLEFSPVQQVSRKGLSEVNGSEVVFRPGSLTQAEIPA